MDLKVITALGEEWEVKSCAEFEKCLHVRYLSCLEYQNERVASILLKKYEKAERRGWITKKQKWLGCYYGTHVNNVCRPLTIAWIDQEVGYGVFARESIPAKTWIGEYTGILRKRRWLKRWENLYCFDYTIGEKKSTSYVIDAKCAGNHTRFINHSFNPNVGLVSIDHGHSIHVVLYTLQEISSGEQLLYDYGDEYWVKRKAPRVLQPI